MTQSDPGKHCIWFAMPSPRKRNFKKNSVDDFRCGNRFGMAGGAGFNAMRFARQSPQPLYIVQPCSEWSLDASLPQNARMQIQEMQMADVIFGGLGLGLIGLMALYVQILMRA